ncbi:hypothetical protein HYW55_05600 [Candidatus Gottesmanbacteria bacterium]|nr:hypothetical protein [Candidatus Gottesmanbacteria bacterium]
MKRIILVVGNEFLPMDNKPIKLLPFLGKLFPEFHFLHFDPTEELPENIGDSLVCIDTVSGTTNVKCITSLQSFSQPPRNSVHDFDLYTQLSLLQKMGKLKKLFIIGVPQKGNFARIKKEIKEIFTSSGF